MQINKKIATEVMPSTLVAITLLLLLARTATGFYERANPEQFKSKDLIEWRKPLDGLAESKSTGKPVFLYFSGAAYVHKDEQFRRNYFSEPKIAADINANYIPVKVWDSTFGDQPKDPIVEQMQDKYLQWYSQPAIHVLPLECQLVKNERYRLPHFYCYGPIIDSRKAMFAFVDENVRYHPLPVSPSRKISWTRVEEAQAKSKLEHKPVLYFFARHNDHECNEAMREFFDEANCKQNQLSNYVCCMVYDHSPSGAKNPQAVNELINKYKIQTYPTFIVENAPLSGKSDKVIGFRGHESMEQFLALNITNLKDSAPNK